jgi:hypothetical protein
MTALAYEKPLPQPPQVGERHLAPTRMGVVAITQRHQIPQDPNVNHADDRPTSVAAKLCIVDSDANDDTATPGSRRFVRGDREMNFETVWYNAAGSQLAVSPSIRVV